MLIGTACSDTLAGPLGSPSVMGKDPSLPLLTSLSWSEAGPHHSLPGLKGLSALSDAMLSSKHAPGCSRPKCLRAPACACIVPADLAGQRLLGHNTSTRSLLGPFKSSAQHRILKVKPLRATTHGLCLSRSLHCRKPPLPHTATDAGDLLLQVRAQLRTGALTADQDLRLSFKLGMVG